MRNSYIRRLSLILLGLFVFPIIFQSVHTVFHVINGYTNIVLEKQDSNDLAISLFHSNDKCLICDYHFSVNNIVKKVPLERKSSFKERQHVDKVIFQYVNSIVSIKIPRAPPVVIV
ncbi:MAG: hypothetical protein IMY73_04730 [Bacteroidetes bacterium]|nr:hypothetical protein [Bacteroidota bacterium]